MDRWTQDDPNLEFGQLCAASVVGLTICGLVLLWIWP